MVYTRFTVLIVTVMFHLMSVLITPESVTVKWECIYVDRWLWNCIHIYVNHCWVLMTWTVQRDAAAVCSGESWESVDDIAADATDDTAVTYCWWALQTGLWWHSVIRFWIHQPSQLLFIHIHITHACTQNWHCIGHLAEMRMIRWMCDVCQNSNTDVCCDINTLTARDVLTCPFPS